jgi:hypothetical protein
VYWTEQHEAEQNKRRKRKRNKAPIEEEEVDILGHRPLEKDFQCACDFNPVSLHLLTNVAVSPVSRIISTFFSLFHLLHSSV